MLWWQLEEFCGGSDIIVDNFFDVFDSKLSRCDDCIVERKTAEEYGIVIIRRGVEDQVDLRTLQCKIADVEAAGRYCHCEEGVRWQK